MTGSWTTKSTRKTEIEHYLMGKRTLTSLNVVTVLMDVVQPSAVVETAHTNYKNYTRNINKQLSLSTQHSRDINIIRFENGEKCVIGFL